MTSTTTRRDWGVVALAALTGLSISAIVLQLIVSPNPQIAMYGAGIILASFVAQTCKVLEFDISFLDDRGRHIGGSVLGFTSAVASGLFWKDILINVTLIWADNIMLAFVFLNAIVGLIVGILLFIDSLQS